MSSTRAPNLTLHSLLGLAAAGLFASGCDVDPIGGGSGVGGSGSGGEGAVVSTSTEGQVATSVGTGGSGQGGAGTGGSSVGGGPAAPAVALFGDEIPDVGGGESTSVSSTGTAGGNGFEADRLYLFLSDTSVACNDPFGYGDDCSEPSFKATIGLPPEYQQVGTYSLSDPAIISNFGEQFPDGGGLCSGGGGSFIDGTIRISLIDDQEVRVILEGTSPATLDGAHSVLRCSAAQPETSSVIGYFPSDLPPQGSGSSVATTGGGGAEKFILVFADHGQSCSDPFQSPGPGETFNEVVIRLPPEYLVPGVYDLADPNLDYEVFQFVEMSAATGGSGGDGGTLTILEVGPDTIELELAGTPYDYANGAGVVPRCN